MPNRSVAEVIKQCRPEEQLRGVLGIKIAIESGLPVVVDATFLNRSRRQDFERLANELRVEFRIIDCDAPFEELCRRIRNRRSDPSEATIEVLEMPMETHQPLTREEMALMRAKP